MDFLATMLNVNINKSELYSYIVKIRKYSVNDEKQIIKLIEDSLYSIFKTKPKNVKIEKDFFDKNGIFYVAELDKIIIGCVGIKKQNYHTARLKKMYVNSRYHGKGIAQKLYSKAQLFAKNQGYKKIILSTTPQMKAAIKFYIKQGFIKYRTNKKTNSIFFYKHI